MARSACILLLLPVFCVLSCSRRQDGESGPVEITHMMWGAANEVKQVNLWLAEFERTHPDIKVKNIHVSGRSYSQKLLTMLAGNVPPDVAFCYEGDYGLLVRKGALTRLPDERVDTEAYFDEVIKAYYYEGGYYAIPRTMNTYVVFYNEDLFEQEGVSTPTGDWTWDDFLNAAKRLTKDTDGDGFTDQFGCLVSPIGITYAGTSFALQNEGELIGQDGSFVGDDPQHIERNVETLTFLRDLQYKHRVAPTSSYVQQAKVGGSLFIRGKVAMHVDGTWYLMQAREAEDFRWNIAPLPYRRKKANTIQSACYIIPKTAAHPEEALLLVEWLTSRKINEDLARTGRCIPPRKAVARSDIFLKGEGFPPGTNMKAILESLEVARKFPLTEKTSLMEDTYWEEVSKTFQEKPSKTIKQALIDTGKRVR